MKNRIYNIGIGLLALTLVGCQDDWDAHYDQTIDSEYGNSSLFEVMSEQSELSDFCEVLKATKSFANSRMTEVSYADVLNGDQYFTVWAPVNGTFNKDSILNLCKTSEGDSLVELQFIKNHIARYGHSVNGAETDVLMLNGKTLTQDATSMEQVSMLNSNIATRNGLLHMLKSPVTYYYNIYEALVALPEYQHIGSFLHSYQIDELNEKESTPKGIENGKTIYVDSVFEWENELLSLDYSHIEREDSDYWMIVPTKSLWDSLYTEAETYFNYAYIDKADSVHERNTHYALMQDLIYNPRTQTSINDSIVSIAWYGSTTDNFHTYYKPFEPGGLFATNWVKVQDCSNGKIYQVDQWPFDQQRTYFKRINVEAESGYLYKYDEGVTNKKLTIESKTSNNDAITVSNSRYVVVTPATQTDKYYVEYELPNVLSGDYDVCVVFLPRNVDPSLPFSDDIVPAGRRNRRASKFSATIYYAGTDGSSCSVESKYRYNVDPNSASYYVKGGNTDKTIPFLFDCNLKPDSYSTRAFINDPFAVDTVKLCTFHFPTCNYDQITCTNRLRITNAITSSETNTYWGNWFIDRILLLPHKN